MASDPAARSQGRAWRGWIAATLAACALAVPSGLSWDTGLARHFSSGAHHIHLLGEIFSSPNIVACLTLLVGTLAGLRIWLGRLPQIGKSAMVASGAALFAFTANDFVLKGVFGRPNVESYLATGDTGFHWLQGSFQSSFPSGHGALAAAALTVLACLHPRLVWAAIAAQALACGLMVAGGWHFLSDTIAGTWVGGTAGLLAADLWRQHLAAHDGGEQRSRT